MLLYKLQKHIFKTLNDNPQVTCNIYDFIPSDEEMPYIAIGEDRAIEFNTKTEIGKEITTTIHVWGECRSMLEIKRLLGAIEESLCNDFEVDGEAFEFHKMENLEVVRETVELTHGQIEISYRTSKGRF